MPKFHIWRTKLITKDDPFHIHKTLGSLALLSFLFRFTQFGEDFDMAFLSYPHLTIPTLLIHLSLSLSSLIFKIPSKRITTGGYRIWPEYRLHSIVFACRSITTMALTHIETRYYHRSEPNYTWNLIIVLISCRVADLCSQSVPKSQRSNTIRGFDVPPLVRYFFSVVQLYATAGTLYGHRRYTTQYLFVFVIQMNAFMMTVQRKNLGGHRKLLGGYGMMLLFGFGVGIWEHVQMESFFLLASVGNLAAFLRMGPWGVDKYVLWVGMGILVRYWRPMFKEDEEGEVDDWVKNLWVFIWIMSLSSVLVLGYYKTTSLGNVKCQLHKK